MAGYPQSFQKPENALKRAEELINVNQKSAALNALHEVITSKRHRTWQKTLEKIMFKYVEYVLPSEFNVILELDVHLRVLEFVG